MAIDVTVLRVFTDADGKFGNPLGVVDASTVDPADRQRIATELGYSETIFIDLPEHRSEHRPCPDLHPRHRITFRRASDRRRVVVAARHRPSNPHPPGACRRRTGELRRATGLWSGRGPNGRRISRSMTSSPPTSSSPPIQTTIPTTSRTTCGRGPTGTTACCAPGCSRPGWAYPRTRRPARRPFASPTTSAAT